MLLLRAKRIITLKTKFLLLVRESLNIFSFYIARALYTKSYALNFDRLLRLLLVPKYRCMRI
jgi:hypothetical protein